MYTSANVPGTGLYYRRYYKHNHGHEPLPFAAAFVIGAGVAVSDSVRYRLGSDQ
jgi:hypothetical protein